VFIRKESFRAISYLLQDRDQLTLRTNQLELGDIRSETRRVLKNIRAILEAAGSSLRSVVRVGVFLADLNDFEGMNEVFQEFFPENPPARTTVGCALPEIKVEIDCIARVNSTSRVRGWKA
jgi:reactive intermediate/imine deaminase